MNPGGTRKGAGRRGKRNANGPAAELSDVMTVKEVARYLNCHPYTVHRLLRQRAIPSFRVGGGWRLRRSREAGLGGAVVPSGVAEIFRSGGISGASGVCRRRGSRASRPATSSSPHSSSSLSARHNLHPSHTSPKERARSTYTRSSRTATLCAAAAGASNNSCCEPLPVISCASCFARARL